MLSKMHWWLNSSCCSFLHHTCRSARCTMFAVEALGWCIIFFEGNRKQCCGLISLHNYHSFIVTLLNEVHDGTAVWLSLMVSPRSLHIIKQPHQPILSSQPLLPSSFSFNVQFKKCNRAKPFDGIKPHQEDKHGLAGTTHHFIIIQNTNIQLTAWKEPWQELKWWTKSQWCRGAWQLLCWGRAAEKLEAMSRIVSR